MQPVDVFLEGWTPAYGSAYAVDEELDDDPPEVSLEEVLAKRYAEKRTEKREAQIGVEK